MIVHVLRSDCPGGKLSHKVDEQIPILAYLSQCSRFKDLYLFGLAHDLFITSSESLDNNSLSNLNLKVDIILLR